MSSYTPRPRPTGRRPASVKDVARVAGVSIGTVSNFLNKPEVVALGTRARVQAAMDELGFVRNEFARQLRTGASRVFAYVMFDARNPFFADVAEGAEMASTRRDFSLFLCNSNSRSDREDHHLASLVQQRVQGILITPVNPHSAALAEVSARGVPAVIVDRTRKDAEVCTVSVDDVMGGRLAMEHLLDLGHRRVALVGGPTSLGQVKDRFDGARTVWEQAGLRPDHLTVLPTSSLTVGEGREAGQRLAGTTSSRRPTAAFCANDLLALGLLQHSVAVGRRVPEDVSIVGYDDIEFAAAAAVPLTSVRQPRTLLGKTGAELLFAEAFEDQHEHQQVLYEPELVVRSSSGTT